ncbi:MAG: DoxX family protein [Prolixibacteraceae bacterium]|nr:DoxX family protein [Prolixibacteraceae bacterium]
MKIVLIILQVIVATIFIIAGFLKLTNSYRRFIPENKLETNNETAQIFPKRYMRMISLIEIACAIILYVSLFVETLKIVTIITTLLLIVIIIGAPLTHIKLGEHREAALTVLLLFMLVFITFFRFL